jgi:hypothetical protein
MARKEWSLSRRGYEPPTIPKTYTGAAEDKR